LVVSVEEIHERAVACLLSQRSTRTTMLRATPGRREINPARSSVSSI
jgi:hypothetical protein